MRLEIEGASNGFVCRDENDKILVYDNLKDVIALVVSKFKNMPIEQKAIINKILEETEPFSYNDPQTMELLEQSLEEIKSLKEQLREVTTRTVLKV